MGTAPAIATVKVAFGSDTAESWLEIQLNDLSEFSGARTKLSTRQIEQTAKVILYKFGYLTLTQLMHFFLLFKSGAYGKFYGSVDPMAITEAMQRFDEERAERVARYQEEQRLQEQESQRLLASEDARRLREALSVSNMSLTERLELAQSHKLTVDEIAEVGWLFRMGYERDRPQTDPLIKSLTSRFR